jgi:hypothetical protein
MRWPQALLATLLAALALAACGSDSDPAEDPAPRPAESVDPLPRLEEGWRPHLNPAGGFAFGLPPGWKASDRGTATLVRSFDRLAVVSISADRTREALELPLGEFASRALAARPGYEDPLKGSKPREFEHRYDAAAVRARGIAESSGVEQRIALIVLRRGKLATFTAVIGVNARPAGAASGAIAEHMVETLRSRPVGGAAG